jgi:hypothetical protein
MTAANGAEPCTRATTTVRAVRGHPVVAQLRTTKPKDFVEKVVAYTALAGLLRRTVQPQQQMLLLEREAARAQTLKMLSAKREERNAEQPGSRRKRERSHAPLNWRRRRRRQKGGGRGSETANVLCWMNRGRKLERSEIERTGRLKLRRAVKKRNVREELRERNGKPWRSETYAKLKPKKQSVADAAIKRKRHHVLAIPNAANLTSTRILRPVAPAMKNDALGARRNTAQQLLHPTIEPMTQSPS